MTAPTVVQDCILFAHNSKDLTREGNKKQKKTPNNTKPKPQTKNTTNTSQQPPPKIEINAGETVKHRELVPLNASLICSPQ